MSASTEAIIYPEKYAPKNSSVFVRNEIEIPVAPNIVWAWLVRASLWSNWYPNSSNVQLKNGSLDLANGTSFRWKTFGVTIDSVVEEFVPFQRLAWNAKAFGIEAYHAWLITKTETGCHVLTEETQNGFIARLGKLLMPKRMHTQHQIWLENLKKKSLSNFNLTK